MRERNNRTLSHYYQLLTSYATAFSSENNYQPLAKCEMKKLCFFKQQDIKL